MRPRSVLPPLALMALSACASPQPPAPVETTGMPNAELALQRTIMATNRDLADLGTLNTPPSAMTPDPALPDELKRNIWFVWRGPLTPAIRRLGKQIGYAVTISGRPHPILVQTNTVAPVIDHLRTLGEQAGTQATVSVDPASHSLAVIYHD